MPLGFTIITAYSAGNLSDNTCLASRATGAAFRAQVGGSDVVVQNTSGKDILLDIMLELGSASWTAFRTLRLFRLGSKDNSVFAYAAGTLPPPAQYLVHAFEASRATESGARNLLVEGLILPPGYHKFVWESDLNVTTAAASNRASYQTYTEDTVA